MMLLIISCSDDGNSVAPILKPTIASISQRTVSIGDLITIYGKNFGTVPDSSFVSFAGTRAIDYASWNDTEIKVKVPEGSKSGKLFVKVSELFVKVEHQNSNEIDITIITSKTSPNEMILIPAGTFQMGNTGAYWGVIDEKPIHTVTISRAFYMSKYEITQSQYLAVMGNNPSYFIGDNLPVERVTWYNAVGFCNALSQLEGKTPCYTINGADVTCNYEANGYRLPTEAEWEYACKAGATTDFYSGSLIHEKDSPIDPYLDTIGWYWGNANRTTHTVGQKQPNAFGLYDMSGNVFEWCWDWYSSYSSTAVTDPIGALSGAERSARSGSRTCYAYCCRSTFRGHSNPVNSFDDTGFRIVRVGN